MTLVNARCQATRRGRTLDEARPRSKRRVERSGLIAVRDKLQFRLNGSVQSNGSIPPSPTILPPGSTHRTDQFGADWP